MKQLHMTWKTGALALFLASPYGSGCGTSSIVYSAIEGDWSIDSMEGSQEIFRCFQGNLVTFEARSVHLPTSNNMCDFGTIQATDSRGAWSIPYDESGPLIIQIESHNGMFAGSYEVTFHDDSVNRLLRMTLSSPEMSWTLTKGMYDYTREREHIEWLARRTKGG